MRIVVQRVTEASVTVDSETTGSIGAGLLVLVGVEHGDSDADADWLASKTAGLRIFNDDAGVMNRSVSDAGGRVLAVSQHRPGRVTVRAISGLRATIWQSRFMSAIARKSPSLPAQRSSAAASAPI